MDVFQAKYLQAMEKSITLLFAIQLITITSQTAYLETVSPWQNVQLHSTLLNLLTSAR